MVCYCELIIVFGTRTCVTVFVSMLVVVCVCVLVGVQCERH